MRRPEPARSSSRTLTCIGLNWKAEVSIKTTLTLLQGKTSERWSYSEEPTADVVIFDAGNALARALVKRQATQGHPGQVFVSTGDTDDDNHLSVRLPIGAHRLIETLNEASLRLENRPRSAAMPQQDSVCDRLDEAMHVRGALGLAIRAGADTGLYKLSEKTLHWPRDLTLDETVGVLASDIEIRVLTEGNRAEIAALEQTSQIQVSGEQLLWAIGMTRSKGSLIRRIDPDSRYRLRRWPNFGVLGRSSTDMRCASMLLQRELSPLELATSLGLPISHIGSFINASALCGLLTEAPASAASHERASRASADTGRRFGRVLQRLRDAFAI